MGRERVYRNNAERQAAYRERYAHREPVAQRRLANLSQELHGLLWNAVRDGTNYVPAAVLGKRADDTLIHLMGYVTRGAVPNRPKPRRHEEEGLGDGAAGEDPTSSR